MKLQLIAVGSLKSSHEQTWFDDYRKRLTLSFDDISLKSSTKEKENSAILQKLIPGAYIICLDEKGQNLSTTKLYHHLFDKVAPSFRTCQFVIGGADGLMPQVLEKAHLKLCFGALTWPHKLVRLMLIEQLYRCQQIHNHHPYHRD